jgi:hypothetical protein
MRNSTDMRRVAVWLAGAMFSACACLFLTCACLGVRGWAATGADSAPAVVGVTWSGDTGQFSNRRCERVWLPNTTSRGQGAWKASGHLPERIRSIRRAVPERCSSEGTACCS